MYTTLKRTCYIQSWLHVLNVKVLLCLTFYEYYIHVYSCIKSCNYIKTLIVAFLLLIYHEKHECKHK